MEFIFVDIFLLMFIGCIFIALGNCYMFVAGCVMLAVAIAFCIFVCTDGLEKSKAKDAYFEEV